MRESVKKDCMASLVLSVDPSSSMRHSKSENDCAKIDSMVEHIKFARLYVGMSIVIFFMIIDLCFF